MQTIRMKIKLAKLIGQTMIFKNKRHPKLLKLAKGKPCVMCGRDDGSTVAAHSNLQEHGKGMGTKAHDAASAWLCYPCHAEYDQGNTMSKTEKRSYILEAIVETYIQMWEQGLIEVTNGSGSGSVSTDERGSGEVVGC